MTVYTLFGSSGGDVLVADTNTYTMGVEFKVSVPGCTLTGIGWYSAPGAGSLPETIALFTVSGTLVHSEAASWSGAAGTGKVWAAFSSPPALTASAAYVAAVYSSGGFNWYSGTHHYWDTGAGAGGISSGPLSAPDNAGSANGQDIFDSSGPLAFPSSSFQATNYWVDPEVTVPGGVSHTATASLTVTPGFSAGRARGKYRAGALTVTPSFSAGRTRGHYRAGTLLVVPAFGAARSMAHVRQASLLVTPSFLAVPSGGEAPQRQTGSWWGLDSVLKESREEFEAFISRPPLACPVDGEPLRPPPGTPSGSGIELYCPYCGWQYPRDYVRPQRP